MTHIFLYNDTGQIREFVFPFQVSSSPGSISASRQAAGKTGQATKQAARRSSSNVKSAEPILANKKFLAFTCIDKKMENKQVRFSY
jgi:hypothetical protein